MGSSTITSSIMDTIDSVRNTDLNLHGFGSGSASQNLGFIDNFTVSPLIAQFNSQLEGSQFNEVLANSQIDENIDSLLSSDAAAQAIDALQSTLRLVSP